MHRRRTTLVALVLGSLILPRSDRRRARLALDAAGAGGTPVSPIALR
jgi:hypothetical protein